MTQTLYIGQSEIVLKQFPDNYFHSLITDPPAGIGLMGKEWDHDKGGRDQWISWLSEILQECFRVLRPGAYGLIWAIPRTSHWTAFAAENAGFEIRDIVHHLFGSGMPMGQNVSKAFDKRAGVEGDVIGVAPGARNGNGGNAMYGAFATGDTKTYLQRAPASELARQWEGWHTRLKPAVEHWILVRKPHTDAVIDNLATFGVGALNIEASRVPRTDGFEKAWDTPVTTNISSTPGAKTLLTMTRHTVDLSANKPNGGFPANLTLSHADGCSDGEGCVIGCPVKELDQQSGNSKSVKSQRGKVKVFTQEGDQWVGESTERGFKDSGGASRFFNTFDSNDPWSVGDSDVDTTFRYLPKVASSERVFYCRTCNNFYPFVVGRNKIYEEHNGHERIAHPTPKSTKLMTWLLKLVTPENGFVLDPFVGTGSTAVACYQAGFSCTGIDMTPEYIQIAAYRLAQEKKDKHAEEIIIYNERTS